MKTNQNFSSLAMVVFSGLVSLQLVGCDSGVKRSICDEASGVVEGIIGTSPSGLWIDVAERVSPEICANIYGASTLLKRH